MTKGCGDLLELVKLLGDTSIGGEMSRFVELMNKEKAITNKALVEFWGKEKLDAMDLDRNLAQMVELIEKQFMRGGKRARSMLVRLGYRFGGGKMNKEIIKVSLFVELVHFFVLVHDDIADRDYKRYGGKTLEVEYGEWFQRQFGRVYAHFGTAQAVVAGDLIKVMAHQVLHEARIEAGAKSRCELQMTKTLKQVVAGWHLHQIQNHMKIGEVREEEFLKGMRMVSGSYTFEGPLRIGLILAGKKGQGMNVLDEYAYHAGMAFQIQDDILGVFGETEKTGKPVGNDLREGKKTLLVLVAYKRAGEKERKFMERWVGSDLGNKELRSLQKIIKETRALEYSEEVAKKHVREAVEVVEKLEVGETRAKEILKQLAEFVVGRNY